MLLEVRSVWLVIFSSGEGSFFLDCSVPGRCLNLRVARDVALSSLLTTFLPVPDIDPDGLASVVFLVVCEISEEIRCFLESLPPR